MNETLTFLQTSVADMRRIVAAEEAQLSRARADLARLETMLTEAAAADEEIKTLRSTTTRR